MKDRRRIAVSNIAWPDSAGEEAIDVLTRLGVGGIEVAPAKVLGGWDDGLWQRAQAFRRRVEDKGLTVSSLQAWLYGVEGVALFGSDDERRRLAQHMKKVARLAGILGARACVYGAPKSRDRGDLDPSAAWDIAVAFFRDVGPAYAEANTLLTFEPNAALYGCNFVRRTDEAIRLVKEIATPGIALQLDTGTLFLEGEDISVIATASPVMGHLQVSEPKLCPLGTGAVTHEPIAAALRAAGWNGWISIEMLAGERWREAVPAAVDLIERVYL